MQSGRYTWHSRDGQSGLLLVHGRVELPGTSKFWKSLVPRTSENFQHIDTYFIQSTVFINSGAYFLSIQRFPNHLILVLIPKSLKLAEKHSYFDLGMRVAYWCCFDNNIRQWIDSLKVRSTFNPASHSDYVCKILRLYALLRSAILKVDVNCNRWTSNLPHESLLDWFVNEAKTRLSKNDFVFSSARWGAWLGDLILEWVKWCLNNLLSGISLCITLTVINFNRLLNFPFFFKNKLSDK